ncbi:MAG TPA: deoxyribonuclease IV [Methylomirabilota bacterium]|nr:deoxyribonuclease IV [Methylomirabilota bacterium]
MKRPLDELGAHVSVAGGLALAPARGRALGCGAIQIFVKNQRQWAAPPLAAADARAFRAERRRAGVRHAFAHGSYLVNLACPDPAGWRQAVAAFVDELRRSEALGLDALVVHPGSHLGAGAEAGLDAVARAVLEGLRATRGAHVKIALENTAGAGNVLGRTFGELRALLQRIGGSARVGVCIDTCHLFVAGYDIRAPAGYARAMDECVELVGVRRVLAFHLNDAKAPLGSGLDRHEHIGRGHLGLRPFRLLLNDRRFARVPKVLETPKEPEPQADLANLARLRRLRGRLSAKRSPRPAGRAS